MILSDNDIKRHLNSDRGLDIDNIGDLETQLQPSSFDVRLGNGFSRLVDPGSSFPFPRKGFVIDPDDPDSIEYEKQTFDDAYLVEPGEFVLGTTKESISLPDNLAAKVEGRSSFGRIGMIIHATAGFADAGFEGQITLEISNLSRFPVELKPDMRVAQLVFHRLESDCDMPYGDKPDAKYQGQKGPVGSRITDENNTT